jgi:hypothetical protein
MGEKQEDEEKEVARKIPYRDYSRDAPPAPEFGRGAAKGKGKDRKFLRGNVYAFRCFVC